MKIEKIYQTWRIGSTYYAVALATEENGKTTEENRKVKLRSMSPITADTIHLAKEYLPQRKPGAVVTRVIQRFASQYKSKPFERYHAVCLCGRMDDGTHDLRRFRFDKKQQMTELAVGTPCDELDEETIQTNDTSRTEK